MLKTALRAVIVAAAMTFSVGAAPPVQGDRWSATIDSRNVDQWLSLSKQTVFAVASGHVIAIDVTSGRRLWTSREQVESRPAVGGATIYAPVQHGMIALDARSGATIGRRSFPTTPTMLTTDSMAIAVVAPGVRKVVTRLIGFRDTLSPRWQRALSGDWINPADVGGSVALLYAGDRVLALDAANGNVVAATDGVNDYVGRDKRTLWFSVANGGLKSLDLTTNRSAAIHNSIVRGAVRVEGPTAVAVIDGRLSQLSLPRGNVEPLRVDGRWVGGPANGVIFVSRSDGTYAVNLSDGKGVRLVTNTSESAFLTANGRNVFFLTNSGDIVVADLTTVRALFAWPTKCAFVEGVHVIKGGALVHCDDSAKSSHLYAFRL